MMRRARVLAIVPAAGSGKRLGLSSKKPFVILKGKPLLYYALKALNSSDAVTQIFVAAQSSEIRRIENIVRRYKLNKVKRVIVGGRTRLESVGNCLKEAADDFEVALVHDAARPLIDADLIDRSVKLALKYGACVAAVPESDTVKSVDDKLFITKTLDRDRIFRAQTPQAFRMDILKKAYAACARRGGVRKATDDSGLVEAIGCRVKIVESSYRNIKVTTKVDLKLAEVLL